MRRAALTTLAILAASSLPAPTVRAAGATFDVIGRSDIGARGMNAGLAVGGTCAYVGSRGDAAPVVIDIRDPAHPVVAGQLTSRPGSTPRELRAVGALHEVIVMYYALTGSFNGFDLYRWSTDCLKPTLVGTLDMGSVRPHEFFLWRDPTQPARVLLYTAIFGGPGNGIRITDITDPTAPRALGAWPVPPELAGNAEGHSISISGDGRTAYISLWTAGLAMADVSDFASAQASPAIRLLTPASALVRTPPGNVHSAVALSGTSMVLITDERYPAPYGTGCPFGPAHVVDVANPAAPRIVSTIQVPENSPPLCATAPGQTWTSHNPTLTAHLALISWYSGGLEAIDLADPVNPVRLAELRPDGVTPHLRDLQLGTTASLTWSYPVIAGGLIYVADINQGLLVLAYHGPHEAEVSGTVLAEGNSNVAERHAATSPSPGASPVPSPSTGAGAPAPTIPARIPWLPIVAGVALLAIAVAAALVRRRRPGPR